MPYNLETIRANQEYIRKLREKDKAPKEVENKMEYEKLNLDCLPKKKDFHGDCDHPNTLENGTATILYIIIMLVGAIFNDRWLIWATVSFVYFKFIGRHKKKK